jgi:hypothetical protein
LLEQKLKSLNSSEILTELEECKKEIKVYYDMQQILTFDYIDFVRWTEQVQYRKTLIG